MPPVRAGFRMRGTRATSNARASRPVAGVAQVLAAVHADRLAGHGGGAFNQEQRRDRHVIGPDSTLERKFGLRALEPFLVLLLVEDLARPGPEHAARTERVD